MKNYNYEDDGYFVGDEFISFDDPCFWCENEDDIEDEEDDFDE